jgi:hypothetical protein
MVVPLPMPTILVEVSKRTTLPGLVSHADRNAAPLSTAAWAAVGIATRTLARVAAPASGPADQRRVREVIVTGGSCCRRKLTAATLWVNAEASMRRR